MVAFKNLVGQMIELSSQNYQFPDTDDKDWDGNWLLIEIKVVENNKTWKRIDPFLLTSDWLGIIDWFGELSKYVEPKSSNMSFTEPNLEFELLSVNKESDKIKFRIKLALECVPSFHKGEWSVAYEFELNAVECKIISDNCLEEYKKFPERR